MLAYLHTWCVKDIRKPNMVLKNLRAESFLILGAQMALEILGVFRPLCTCYFFVLFLFKHVAKPLHLVNIYFNFHRLFQLSTSQVILTFYSKPLIRYLHVLPADWLAIPYWDHPLFYRRFYHIEFQQIQPQFTNSFGVALLQFFFLLAKRDNTEYQTFYKRQW